MNIDRFPGIAKLYRRAIIVGTRLIHGIDKNKVVFCCFKGRSYGDNPRAISEKLHELRPSTDQVWLFTKSGYNAAKESIPDYVRPVYVKGKEAYRELSTARVWVDNFTKDNTVWPAKGKQFYIQTWHGDRPIKKICYDVEKYKGYRIEEEADLILTGSDFAQKIYRTAFRYNGEYMNEGCPRNDILVKNDPRDVQRIRKALGIPEGEKLMLYAPTYREDAEVIGMEDKFDPLRTLDVLEEKTGCKWRMLFRAHYKTAKIDLEAMEGRMTDVTGWDSMSELLLVTDCLITDYSSCAMDYAILGRPAFFYQSDYDHYLSTRDVYYDPREVPLMIAHSQEELEKLIRDTGEEEAKANCRAMYDYYGIRETGHATESICKYIIDKLS